MVAGVLQRIHIDTYILASEKVQAFAVCEKQARLQGIEAQPRYSHIIITFFASSLSQQ